MKSNQRGSRGFHTTGAQIHAAFGLGLTVLGIGAAQIGPLLPACPLLIGGALQLMLAAYQYGEQSRLSEPDRVPSSPFDRDSEYSHLSLLHNGKAYAVIDSCLSGPLAVFLYSDLAIQWRNERFPGADVAEINDAIPAVDDLSAAKVCPGASVHRLSS